MFYIFISFSIFFHFFTLKLKKFMKATGQRKTCHTHELLDYTHLLLQLSISDNVFYTVTKVVSIVDDKSSDDPWSGKSFNLNSDRWATTFLLNIPRNIIYDFKLLYEKHYLEKWADHKYPGRSTPRGLNPKEKKRHEELSSKISSSVEKIAA